jgi:uncharacterized protein (DUF3820 family)
MILGGTKPSSKGTSAKPLTDNDVMTFGTHKDKRLENVPASYLLWLWDEGWHARTNEPLGAYLKDSLTALLKEKPDYILKHKP